MCQAPVSHVERVMERLTNRGAPASRGEQIDPENKEQDAQPTEAERRPNPPYLHYCRSHHHIRRCNPSRRHGWATVGVGLAACPIVIGCVAISAGRHCQCHRSRPLERNYPCRWVVSQHRERAIGVGILLCCSYPPASARSLAANRLAQNPGGASRRPATRVIRRNSSAVDLHRPASGIRIGRISG